MIPFCAVTHIGVPLYMLCSFKLLKICLRISDPLSIVLKLLGACESPSEFAKRDFWTYSRESDSAGLGWNLRFSMFNKFLGDVECFWSVIYHTLSSKVLSIPTWSNGRLPGHVPAPPLNSLPSQSHFPGLLRDILLSAWSGYIFLPGLLAPGYTGQ